MDVTALGELAASTDVYSTAGISAVLYEAHPSASQSTNLTSNATSSPNCKIRSGGGPMVNMTIPFTTFSICVLGNLFAIVFLWKSNQRSDKKQHIFYTLVMTLACCDFVSVIVTSPITFMAYMSRECIIEMGGMSLCRYSGFAMMFFGIGSVAIVFAMSLERFIAIRFTMFYQRTMTTHKTRVFLLIIIITLLIISSFPLFGFGEVAQQSPGTWCFLDWKSNDRRHQAFNFSVAGLGVALMLGTIICNVVVVVRVITTRRRMRHRNSTHGLLAKRKRRKIAQQETQMVVLLGLMTAVFVVCYLPLLLRIIINQISSIYSDEFVPSDPSHWDPDLFAVRMATINPIVDPWVYILCRRSILLKVFRFFKLLFTCRCKKEMFQEICISSREFRRRKSTRRQYSNTVTSSLYKMSPTNHKKFEHKFATTANNNMSGRKDRMPVQNAAKSRSDVENESNEKLLLQRDEPANVSIDHQLTQ